MSVRKTRISSIYCCQGVPAPACQALLVGTESPQMHHPTACSPRYRPVLLFGIKIWVGWEVKAQYPAMSKTIIHATKLLNQFCDQ